MLRGHSQCQKSNADTRRSRMGRCARSQNRVGPAARSHPNSVSASGADRLRAGDGGAPRQARGGSHCYDHTFPLRSKAQKGTKRGCLCRSTAKSVRMYLRKQTHYRARGGEWVQQSAEPYCYVCRMLFQAQMSRALNPVNLSLERQTTSIFQ